MKPSVLIIFLLLSLHPQPSQSLKISVVGACVNPLLQSSQEQQQQQQQVQGIALEISAAEFYSSFASIFQLSDGSSISIPEAQERSESLRYMQVLQSHLNTCLSQTVSKHHGRRSFSTQLVFSWMRRPATTWAVMS